MISLVISPNIHTTFSFQLINSADDGDSSEEKRGEDEGGSGGGMMMLQNEAANLSDEEMYEKLKAEGSGG